MVMMALVSAIGGAVIGGIGAVLTLILSRDHSNDIGKHPIPFAITMFFCAVYGFLVGRLWP